MQINQLELSDRTRQEQELADARNRLQSGDIEFSQTELSDISRLDARRNKSIGTAKFDFKKSGLDTVLLKRVEAEKAKKIFDSSSIQNKNFDLGISSGSSQADRNFFINQQQEHRKQLQKAEQNKIDAQRQTQVGKQLQTVFGTDAQIQKEKLRENLLKIHGGNALSPIALARLQKKGLI